MGGFGSGLKNFGQPRRTVDELARIDLRAWTRRGLIRPGDAFHAAVPGDPRRQAFVAVEVAEDEDALWISRHPGTGPDPMRPPCWTVRIERTPCHLGGERLWFLCPGCGRRAAILYAGVTGGAFSCRTCRTLAYPTQNMGSAERSLQKVVRLRKRLGWGGDPLMGPHGRRPRGMHRSTFERLRDEHDAARRALLDALATMFGAS